MGIVPSKYGYFDLDRFVEWYRKKYIPIYSKYCNENSKCANNQTFKYYNGPIKRSYTEKILDERNCFNVERTADMHSNFVFEDTENIKYIHLKIGCNGSYIYNNINCENQIKINMNIPIFNLQLNTITFKFEFYEPRESYIIKFSYDEIFFPINTSNCTCMGLRCLMLYDLYFKVNNKVVFCCFSCTVLQTLTIKEFNDIALSEESKNYIFTADCLINDIFKKEDAHNELLESIKWHPLTYRQREESMEILDEFNLKLKN